MLEQTDNAVAEAKTTLLFDCYRQIAWYNLQAIYNQIGKVEGSKYCQQLLDILKTKHPYLSVRDELWINLESIYIFNH